MWIFRSLRVAVFSLLLAGPARAGYEDFIHYPVTGNSYVSGTFTGRDGSVWSYFSCQGTKVIQAPSPCLGKGQSPTGSVESGLIAGGCGELTLNWMKAFTGAVNLDIYVNDLFLSSITGGVQSVSNSAGPIVVGQAGHFRLKFLQHDSNAGQVALDNISWTPYVGGGTSAPQMVLSPAATSVVMAATNLLEVSVRATEPDGDALRLWATGLPSGATFAGATGASPLSCTFSWTPTMAQTGNYAVVFNAGDKDGTNRQSLAVLVLTNKAYYYDAEGKAGPELRAALHEIISDRLAPAHRRPGKHGHEGPGHRSGRHEQHHLPVPPDPDGQEPLQRQQRLEQGARLAGIAGAGEHGARPERRA